MEIILIGHGLIRGGIKIFSSVHDGMFRLPAGVSRLAPIERRERACYLLSHYALQQVVLVLSRYQTGRTVYFQEMEGMWKMHDPIVYHGLIWFLLVGGLSGWLASVLVTGRGMGILADIAVGIAGAFVGVFLAGVFGLHAYGFGAYLGFSILGAVILLVIFRGVSGRRRTA